MLTNVAVYRIKPEFVDEFRRRMLKHAETCLREEEGCLRFDVNQSKTDPTLFLMYEQFRDQAAVEAHGKTAHIADFVSRRDGEGWLAERSVYLMDPIFPGVGK
jgi:quinol monooxygenase YgiN